MTENDQPGATPLPPDLRAPLGAAVSRAGSLRAAARRLGVTRSAVDRAHAGLALRPSTIAALRAALGLSTTKEHETK